MKKLIAVFAFALFAIGTFSINARAEHVGKPKIGMKRALAIATKRAGGKLRLKAKELEKEKGRWIYSFEFSAGKGKITEVNVDAYSGKVIGVEHENAKKEAAEEKGEKKDKN